MATMVRFIAELGSNAWPFTHARILNLLCAAARAGANGVKVQLFRSEHFPKQERQQKQWLEFPRAKLAWFVKRAHSLGIKAGASVFDEDAVATCEMAGVDFLKLATREEGNIRLRWRCAQTGLTTFRSVRWNSNRPMAPIYANEIPMGCLPEYPTTRPDWNDMVALPALGGPGRVTRWIIKREMHRVLKSQFDGKWPWGWSSHTADWADVLAAVRLGGASYIEKHLALGADDPEAGWSLMPDEFQKMVEACSV